MGVELPRTLSVVDFAGRFTDRFKNQPVLEGAFPASGRQVFTLTEGRLLRIWDFKSGRSLQTIEPAYPHRRSAPGRWILTSITLSDNGEYAFFADPHNGVGELWEIATGRQLRQYPHLLQRNWPQVHIPGDGSCVYIVEGRTVTRLPGKEPPETR